MFRCCWLFSPVAFLLLVSLKPLIGGLVSMWSWRFPQILVMWAAASVQLSEEKLWVNVHSHPVGHINNLCQCQFFSCFLRLKKVDMNIDDERKCAVCVRQRERDLAGMFAWMSGVALLNCVCGWAVLCGWSWLNLHHRDKLRPSPVKHFVSPNWQPKYGDFGPLFKHSQECS